MSDSLPPPDRAIATLMGLRKLDELTDKELLDLQRECVWWSNQAQRELALRPHRGR